MTPRTPAWWYVCDSCAMQASTLEPVFGDPDTDPVFDWEQRVRALSALRKANAARLLGRIGEQKPPPAKLLDVGCAEGWFLQDAQRRGYAVAGIEPDARMAGRSDPSLNIRTGFFPEALAADERFDIITFNDVFEHLPDVKSAMAACAGHLAPGGALVVNLPNAEGGIYKLSRLAARAGIRGPFERMWQHGYPSPHISYFTPSTLARLASSHGLRERARFSLPAVQARGLWPRIRYDRTRSLAYAMGAWGVAMAAMPVLRLLPPDICVQIFARPAA